LLRQHRQAPSLLIFCWLLSSPLLVQRLQRQAPSRVVIPLLRSLTSVESRSVSSWLHFVDYHCNKCLCFCNYISHGHLNSLEASALQKTTTTSQEPSLLRVLFVATTHIPNNSLESTPECNWTTQWPCEALVLS